MNIETTRDLFVSELRRAYTIERSLTDELSVLAQDAAVDALDGTRERALHEALQEILTDHRAETERHLERVEAAFDAMDLPIDTRTTPALDGAVEEKERFNNVVLADELRPLFYLGTARDIEYLETTVYDRMLGLVDHLDVPEEVVEALEQNRSEDRATLEQLESLEGGEEMDTLVDAVTD